MSKNMNAPAIARKPGRQPERPAERERKPRVCCERPMRRDMWPRAGLVVYRCPRCQRSVQCEALDGSQHHGDYRD